MRHSRPAKYPAINAVFRAEHAVAVAARHVSQCKISNSAVLPLQAPDPSSFLLGYI